MNHQIMTDIICFVSERKWEHRSKSSAIRSVFSESLTVGYRKVVISELPVTVSLFRGSPRKCEREVLQRCPALTACNKL